MHCSLSFYPLEGEGGGGKQTNKLRRCILQNVRQPSVAETAKIANTQRILSAKLKAFVSVTAAAIYKLVLSLNFLI